jgi:hypothetical protein
LNVLFFGCPAAATSASTSAWKPPTTNKKTIREPFEASVWIPRKKWLINRLLVISNSFDHFPGKI